MRKLLDQEHAALKEIKRRQSLAHKVRVKREEGQIREIGQQMKEELLAKMSDDEIKTQVIKEVVLGDIKDYTDIDVDDKKKVLFSPNPGPQTAFLGAAEREVLYGGARGGGKTYALMVLPLRWCMFPVARALILRRTMPELRDVIFKAKQLYEKAFPGTRWASQENTFYFPSGARIEFGYGESREDLMRYQGQSYTFIGIDEAAQIHDLNLILDDLRACLRSTDPVNVPAMLRLTANPGNISSNVLRDQFINAGPEGETFYRIVKLPPPPGSALGASATETKIPCRFIRATLYDNPYLLQDESYVAMLAGLSETRRRQWLEGDWDVAEGMAFPDFEREVHVVKPFEIPPDWTRIRGADWGYHQPGCCLWLAYSPEGDVYVYREFYHKGMVAQAVAQHVRDLEMGERVMFGVLDTQAWENKGGGGPSVGETFNSYQLHFRRSSRSFTNGKSSRVAGAQQVHNLLAVDPEKGRPQLFIFNNCINLIRTLAALPASPLNPDDVDTHAEDHAYDALRYGLQSRAIPVSSWNFDHWEEAAVPEQPAWQPMDPVFGF